MANRFHRTELPETGKSAVSDKTESGMAWTLEELAESGLIAFQGGVYDLADFAHPGGSELVSYPSKSHFASLFQRYSHLSFPSENFLFAALSVSDHGVAWEGRH